MTMNPENRSPDQPSELDRRFLLGGLAGAAGAAAMAMMARPAAAGPLTPPPGPITPTQRPLGEIEPRTVVSQATTPGDATAVFVINQPGSYFLSGPVVGEAGRSGIKITASEVRLDLRGFNVVGVAGAEDGIVLQTPAGSTQRNVAIHDGGCVGWPGSGLVAMSTAMVGVRIERMTFSGNAESGAFAAQYSIFTDCHAIGNGGTGFGDFGSSVYTRCSASENNGSGFAVQTHSVLESCHASGNGNAGFGLATRCVVRNCLSTGNATYGFSTILSLGTIMENCTAAGNRANGFDLNNGNFLRGCTASSCDGSGFNINRYNRMEDCISIGNARGIEGIDGNYITGCICDNNGSSTAANGAGILLTGSDNRVEACNSTGNGTGYAISGGGNFIARNTASGNVVVNWNIAVNNKCLVVAGVNAPAINGSSGGASPGSMDPNANYSF